MIIWLHRGGLIAASKEQTQVYAMAPANAGYVVANINQSLAAHKHLTPSLEAKPGTAVFTGA